MLHILFLLLKIIGCVLLALLCLILLLVLIVLLVPIRYRVSAEKYTDFAAEAEVSWLLHLLGLFMRFDMKEEEGRRLHLRLRIACFTLYDNLHPRKKRTKRIKKKRVSKTKNKNESKAIDEAINIDNIVDKDGAIEADIEADPDIDIDSDIDVDTEKTDWMKRIKSILDKVLEICKGVLHIPSAISQRVRRLKARIDRLLEKKDRILEIYHDEKNHRWMMLFLSRLKKLGLRMLPRIDRLIWHFGFDDPATTGQVLGFMSIFYCVGRERMVLQPEFNEEVMEGEVRMHGHIQLLPVVVFAIRSFLNKQFFTIVKQVKNI